MKVIGLVGASGTGKSTIAAHLAAQGAAHIDADRLVHDILKTDEAVKSQIRDRFGSNVFVGERVDRGALAEIVFGEKQALEALNAIIHPAVIEACHHAVDRLRETGEISLAVVDAALLLEVPLSFKIDYMIALVCDREEQIRRLVDRGGVGVRQIRARLDNQSHLEESFDKADIVVNTNRSKARVLRQIDEIVERLLDDDAALT